MRPITYLTLLALLGSTTAYAAVETPQHYRDSCIGCHARMTGGDGQVLYNRKDGLVHNLKALQKRVAYCEQALQLNWTKEQRAAVVHFLNKRFYQFKHNN